MPNAFLNQGSDKPHSMATPITGSACQAPLAV